MKLLLLAALLLPAFLLAQAAPRRVLLPPNALGSQPGSQTHDETFPDNYQVTMNLTN